MMKKYEWKYQVFSNRTYFSDVAEELCNFLNEKSVKDFKVLSKKNSPDFNYIEIIYKVEIK